MEFVKLRYLIAVAEQRSFSKAAEKCFVSQPTLTRCVQNMEKIAGRVTVRPLLFADPADPGR